MLPVEDWEKAGPILPNKIERKTTRKTREVFMIGPSLAVRSDPVHTHGLNIKRMRYLAPGKPTRRTMSLKRGSLSTFFQLSVVRKVILGSLMSYAFSSHSRAFSLSPTLL